MGFSDGRLAKKPGGAGGQRGVYCRSIGAILAAANRGAKGLWAEPGSNRRVARATATGAAVTGALPVGTGPSQRRHYYRRAESLVIFHAMGFEKGEWILSDRQLVGVRAAAVYGGGYVFGGKRNPASGGGFFFFCLPGGGFFPFVTFFS